MSDNNTDNNSRSDNPRNSWVWRTVFGQIINIDFFLRHWLIVFTTVVLIIFYISGGYLVKTNRSELESLRSQLKIVETERIRARESYMSRIRESQLQKMIDSSHLNIGIQEKPPYELKQK